MLWSTTPLQSIRWHGLGATPIMHQGSLFFEQRTAETGSTTHHKRRPTPHTGALGKSSGPNQNGPFLECKPKSMHSEAFRRFVLSQHCGHGCQSKPFGGLKGFVLIHPCSHPGQTKPSEAFRRVVLSQHCGHRLRRAIQGAPTILEVPSDEFAARPK